MELKDATNEELFEELYNRLNRMNREDEIKDALEKTLGHLHRTLQQNFFRHLIVPAVQYFAKQHEAGWYDLRNEASCETAVKMLPIVDEAALPFI